MTDDRDLSAAEDEVERAKDRMLGTVRDISRQLQPHHLVAELWEDAKIKGADLAEEAVDAVKARPLAATGIVAAIAMFLAREPLMGMAGKLVGGKKDKKGKKAVPAKAAKATTKAAPKPRTQKKNIVEKTA